MVGARAEHKTWQRAGALALNMRKLYMCTNSCVVGVSEALRASPASGAATGDARKQRSAGTPRAARPCPAAPALRPHLGVDDCEDFESCELSAPRHKSLGRQNMGALVYRLLSHLVDLLFVPSCFVDMTSRAEHKHVELGLKQNLHLLSIKVKTYSRPSY